MRQALEQTIVEISELPLITSICRFLNVDRRFFTALLLLLIGFASVIWLFLLFFNTFFSLGLIDKAVKTQKTARAYSLVQQRMKLFPRDHSLKLRLARCHTEFGETEKALQIITDVQKEKPHHKYLPIAIVHLSQNTKKSDSIASKIIPLLESISKKYPPAREELLNAYTVQGNYALREQDLLTAMTYLARSLKLSEQLNKDLSIINYRKRELAKVYNLRAEQMTLQEAPPLAKILKLYEESLDIHPNGQVFLKVARLYSNNPTLEKVESIRLQKAAQSFREAYLFGLTEAKQDLDKSKQLLKISLQKEGKDPRKIEHTLNKLSLE